MTDLYIWLACLISFLAGLGTGAYARPVLRRDRQLVDTCQVAC